MATDNNEIRIPLEGVDSEHCALIVDKGIGKLKDIGSHHVEFNNKQAVVTAPSQDIIAEIVQVIRGLGYNVPTVRRTYPLLLMSCASCAIGIERMLKSQKGVVDVSVNFASATANTAYRV